MHLARMHALTSTTSLILPDYHPLSLTMKTIVAKSVSFHVRYQPSHVVFQFITVTNVANGEKVSAMVTDECKTCVDQNIGMSTV